MGHGVRNIDLRAVIAQGDGILLPYCKRQGRRGAGSKGVGLFTIDRQLGERIRSEHSALNIGLFRGYKAIQGVVGIILVTHGVFYLSGRNDHGTVVAQDQSVLRTGGKGQALGGAGGKLVSLAVINVTLRNTGGGEVGALSACGSNNVFSVLISVGKILVPDSKADFHRRNDHGAVVAQCHGISRTLRQRHHGRGAAGIGVFPILIRQDLTYGILGDHVTGVVGQVGCGAAIINTVGIVFVAEGIAYRCGRRQNSAVITKSNGAALGGVQDGRDGRRVHIGLTVIGRNLGQAAGRNVRTFHRGLADCNRAVQFAIGVILMTHGIIDLNRRYVGAVIVKAQLVRAGAGQGQLSAGRTVNKNVVGVLGLIAGRKIDPTAQLTEKPGIGVCQNVIGIITGSGVALQIIGDGIRDNGQVAADRGNVEGYFLLCAAKEIGQNIGGIYCIRLGFNKAGFVCPQRNGIGHGIAANVGGFISCRRNSRNIPGKAGSGLGDARAFQVGNIAELDIAAHRGGHNAGIRGGDQRRTDGCKQIAQLRHVLGGHVVFFVGGHAFHGILGVFLAGLLIVSVAVQKHRVDLNASVLRCLSLGNRRLAVVGVDLVGQGGGLTMLTGNRQGSVVIVAVIFIVRAAAYDSVQIKSRRKIAGSASGLIPIMPPAGTGAACPVSCAGKPIAVSRHAIRKQDDDLLGGAAVLSKDLLGGIDAGLYVCTAVIDVAHCGGGGSNGGFDPGDIAGQIGVGPVTSAETDDGDLIAGSNAVFVQNAFHELADSSFRVGAAITVHAVGTVDAKYDVGGPDRLDLHQVGSGDGHGHIKVVAAGMGDSLLNGDHAVLGRNERALLHDLAVSASRGGISHDRKHARKHAAEQKDGSDALHGGNAVHMEYLRKT